MLQLLLALGSGHGRGRLAAAAAVAAALPPDAVQPWEAGPRALGGATLAAAPFLTYLFPILKLSCQLSKAQA
jgi:hypothetical protein